MAKFLNTTGISYHLEELIKNTTDRLILISPYLQFHHRIKDHITNLNIQKKDIRIIYRENKLQPEESNWLESQIGVRTSICNTLHAKCYINEKEAIVTSMNLYSFSQQNNDEMGILVSKENDAEIYRDIYKEAERLLTISKEIRISVKEVYKTGTIIPTKVKTERAKRDFSKSKFKSTSAMAKLLGLSSGELFEILEDKGFLKKEGKDRVLTPKGEKFGGEMRKGQYGAYPAWPEELAAEFESE